LRHFWTAPSHPFGLPCIESSKFINPVSLASE
jgi:hypothetical protein